MVGVLVDLNLALAMTGWALITNSVILLGIAMVLSVEKGKGKGPLIAASVLLTIGAFLIGGFI